MSTAETGPAPAGQHAPDPARRGGRALMGDRRSPRYYAEASALPLLTVALILFFTTLPSTAEVFPTAGNFDVTIGAQAPLLVIAMASLLPLICGEYDFSVGATAGLAAILAASAMAGGASLIVALLVATAVGLAIGVVNGLLVTWLNVNSVVATLGMSTIIAGLVQWRTDGKSVVTGIPESLTRLSSETLLGVPKCFWLALATTALVYYVVRHTPYGRYLDAIGVNRSAARLVGLRTERMVMVSFLVSGALAGAAGMLVIAQAGSASPAIGPAFTLPAIAAAFLGVAAIQPGRFNVGGTLVAIIFLAALNSGLNLAGASSYVNDFANGGALIAGVALAGLFARTRARR